MTHDELLLLAQAHRWCQSGYARQLRVRNGLKLVQIAARCGVVFSSVSHWENRRRSPTGRAGLKYARLLDDLAKAEPVAS